MRLAVFSNIFSLRMSSNFCKDSVSGLKNCPGWLVTTAIAVETSWKTAAPLLSPYWDQSGGTAIWQAFLESFLESLTICHPAGTTCAETDGRNKRIRVGTMYSLM